MALQAGVRILTRPLKTCANRHTWHALCGCGDARVCLRCGVGAGTIPCACMTPRWSEAELIRRSMEREART